MYQTLGPFWRAVLDISWGRFCIYYGPFWTLVWAVLAMSRFRPFPHQLYTAKFFYIALSDQQSLLTHTQMKISDA